MKEEVLLIQIQESSKGTIVAHAEDGIEVGTQNTPQTCGKFYQLML